MTSGFDCANATPTTWIGASPRFRTMNGERMATAVAPHAPRSTVTKRRSEARTRVRTIRSSYDRDARKPRSDRQRLLPVAHSAARVPERSARNRDELPRVGAGSQRQLENAIGAGVADLGIGLGRAKAVQPGSTRPDDEFSNAIGRIGRAARRLWGGSRVDVFVAVENDLGVVVVERLPQGLDVLRLAAVNRARIKERLVPIGQAALVGVGREIRSEPYLLGRAHRRRDLTIERDDVPVPEIEAVVALARGP